MLGEDKELQQEFQQLVKGEIELFKAIAKGEGVSKYQHTDHAPNRIWKTKWNILYIIGMPPQYLCLPFSMLSHSCVIV